MKRRTAVLMMIALLGIIPGMAGCPQKTTDTTTQTENPPPTDTANPTASTAKGMHFTNVQAAHGVPYRVQYLFSLKDDDGHAVIIPESATSSVQMSISENGSPLDKEETGIYLQTMAALQMDVVMVLDFSQSMNASGAIDSMINATTSVLSQLKPSHRVAIEEFHDRLPQDNYHLLVPFTFAGAENIPAIVSAMRSFNQATYHGFSTCWDAVLEGLLQLTNPDPNRVRVLMVFTDGKDTSSRISTDQVTEKAKELGVRVFTIGVGAIPPDNETTLKNVAANTGGGYYPMAHLDTFSTDFQQVIQDLSGNYKISYITPKSMDFTVKMQLTYNGLTTLEPIEQPVAVAPLAGDDRIGRLTFIRGAMNSAGNVQITVVADHVPRGVKKLQMIAGAADQPATAQVIRANQGGILSEWTAFVVNPATGLLETTGPELPFGISGALAQFTVTVEGSADPAVIPFRLNNALYANGTYFARSDDPASDIDISGNLVISDIPQSY